MAVATQTIDEGRLMAVLGRAIDDFGAIGGAALVLIGDRLGLYKTLAKQGPLTLADLAERSGISPHYLRSWLVSQAAAGYVDYDPLTERYNLSPEQALALADDNSPYNVVGGFQVFASVIKAEPRIREAFQSGGGMLWGEHDPGLFEGTERFFRPGYAANLVPSWIPALDGVQRKLEAGATAADVGCGSGASTILLAQAYPKSRFVGFDNHAPSIQRARQAAADAGVGDRVAFEVASAQEYPGTEYDLVAYFDCLHDMGDPIGALRHTREALSPDGTVLLVEPMAGSLVEDNFNPLGRVMATASVLICTPNAIASGPTVLGTLATDEQLRQVAVAAGFNRFRRATETPFNRIFEVGP